jgi:hypothetical protein
METALAISLYLLTASAIGYLAYLAVVYRFGCATCGKLHWRDNDVYHCGKCKRSICKDHLTLVEKVSSAARGQIGTQMSGQVIHVSEIERPCGTLFIMTNQQGSSHYPFCKAHSQQLTTDARVRGAPGRPLA